MFNRLTNGQNPAFGPQQIRELTEIFVEKGIEVNSILLDETFIIHNLGCEIFYSYVKSGVKKSSRMMV